MGCAEPEHAAKARHLEGACAGRRCSIQAYTPVASEERTARQILEAGVRLAAALEAG